MTQLETDSQPSASRLSDLNERERNRLFARAQERMQAVWGAWRRDLEDESVVVVPSVTLDQTKPGAGSLAQAFEEAVLVPPTAAPATAAAHDLRHVDTDQAEHR